MGPPVDMVAVEVGAEFDVTWGGCVVAHPANNTIVVIMTANTRKILFFFKPDTSASLIIQRRLPKSNMNKITIFLFSLGSSVLIDGEIIIAHVFDVRLAQTLDLDFIIAARRPGPIYRP